MADPDRELRGRGWEVALVFGVVVCKKRSVGTFPLDPALMRRTLTRVRDFGLKFRVYRYINVSISFVRFCNEVSLTRRSPELSHAFMSEI